MPEETAIIDAILEHLTQAGEPRTAKQVRTALPKSLKRTEEELHRLMAELSQQGRLFEWPAKGKSGPRYGTVSLRDRATGVLGELLGNGPLKAAEVKTALTKRLFGLSAPDRDTLLRSLIRQGLLYQHPRLGKASVMLGLRPPDLRPYLAKVVGAFEAVCKSFGASGVRRDQLAAALGELLGAPPQAAVTEALQTSVVRSPSVAPPVAASQPPVSGLANIILRKMVEIEPRATGGALVSLRNLRRALSMDKEVFDRTIIALANDQKIVLHQHSYPAGLSDEERSGYVDDGQGRLYVGAALPEE